MKFKNRNGWTAVVLIAAILFASVIVIGCCESVGAAVLEEHEHNFGEYELIFAPSKDQNGLEARTCLECFATEEREYVCQHSLKKGLIVKRATCAEEGIGSIVCDECATVINKYLIEKLDCVYGEWTTIEESTCAKHGVNQRTCVNCGKTEEKSIELAECNDYTFAYSEYDVESNVLVNHYVCVVCGNTKYDTENACVGFTGTLRIDAVGVAVNTYRSMSQSTCDRENSACYFSYHGVLVVADHWNQGFEKIKSCSVGDIATIGNDTYKCIEVFYGHNTGPNLTDNDYNDITTHDGDLFMYTCNGCWQNVAIVAWEKV